MYFGANNFKVRWVFFTQASSLLTNSLHWDPHKCHNYGVTPKWMLHNTSTSQILVACRSCHSQQCYASDLHLNLYNISVIHKISIYTIQKPITFFNILHSCNIIQRIIIAFLCQNCLSKSFLPWTWFEFVRMKFK